jgi:hypothetical protein
LKLIKRERGKTMLLKEIVTRTYGVATQVIITNLSAISDDTLKVVVSDGILKAAMRRAVVEVNVRAVLHDMASSKNQIAYINKDTVQINRTVLKELSRNLAKNPRAGELDIRLMFFKLAMGGVVVTLVTITLYLAYKFYYDNVKEEDISPQDQPEVNSFVYLMNQEIATSVGDLFNITGSQELLSELNRVMGIYDEIDSLHKFSPEEKRMIIMEDLERFQKLSTEQRRLAKIVIGDVMD